jgi:hypothetical protein
LKKDVREEIIMKKISSLIIILLIGFLIFALSSSISAANSQTSDLDAELIDKITLEEGNPAGINFGQFTSPSGSLTLYLYPRDYNTSGGEVISSNHMSWTGGTEDDDFEHLGGAHVAVFTFNSPISIDNAAVTLINLPGSIPGTSGAALSNDASMNLSAWSIYDVEGDSTTQNLEQGETVTVSLTDNSGSFRVGAMLIVSANQEVGAYSGIFDVQIDYQ